MHCHAPPTRKKTRAAAAVTLLFLLVYNCTASATARLDYSLETGLLYDDNIRETQSARESDEILIPRLLFTFNDGSSQLDASVAGDLSYYHYLQSTFSDDFRGVLAGTAAWHALPDRLDWIFEDYLGRQPVNVLLDNTPDNQQQTNLFVTGPTLRLRFGDRLRGQLNLRYASSYAERSKEFNGDRESALATLAYDFDASRSVSLNAQEQRVHYSNAVPTLNYDRADAYAGFILKNPHGEIDLDLGYTQLDFQHGGGSDSGPLLRAHVRYDVDARSSLSVGLLRGFSDTAQDLIMDTQAIANLVIGSGLATFVVSPQAYTETRYDVAYAYHGDRFSLSVAPFWRRLDYETDLSFNERSRGGYAYATYQFSALTSLTASAGAERRNYRVIDRTDSDRSVALTLAHELTRHWQWRLQIQRLQRSSSDPSIGYTDHQLLLAIRYTR
jgi:hypothetical protein